MTVLALMVIMLMVVLARRTGMREVLVILERWGKGCAVGCWQCGSDNCVVGSVVGDPGFAGGVVWMTMTGRSRCWG